MDTTTVTCDQVAERELIERYVAGHLDPQEAETLEQHTFGCEACWDRVRTATEVRAAFAAPVVTRAGRSSPSGAPERSALSSWKVWVPLAAAAAIGAVVVGTREWSSAPQPAVDAVRGTEATLSVETTREAAGLRISWTAVEGAEGYELRVFTEEGILLAEELTHDPRFLVAGDDQAAWIERAGDSALYVRIVARSGAGRVLAESALVPILTGTPPVPPP